MSSYREEAIAKIFDDLIPLQRDIKVMAMALNNPPKGASKQDLESVKQQLEISEKVEQRTIDVLKRMDVNVEFEMAAYDKKSK